MDNHGQIKRAIEGSPHQIEGLHAIYGAVYNALHNSCDNPGDAVRDPLLAILQYTPNQAVGGSSAPSAIACYCVTKAAMLYHRQ